MRVRVLAGLVLLATVVTLLPSVAAATPLLTTIGQGDAALGRQLQATNAPLGYLDGDGDGKPGADEPAYWDLDASHSVTVADLRLRPFLSLGIGSSVVVTDPDAGRALQGTVGWFGSTTGGWYADLDTSKTITAGDVFLETHASIIKDGNSALGQPLAYPTTAMGAGSVALDDLDGDRRRDPGEAVYLDLDTSSTVGPPVVGVGDLRLTPPTHSGGTDNSGDDSGGDGGLLGDGASGDGSLRGFDVVLLALAAVNLLGLAYVIRLTRSSRPRNPFK